MGSLRGRALLMLSVGIGVLASLPAPAPTRADSAALESLVAAERAFSETSVTRGMRDAFLTFMADDGIVFRPRATNAKQVWTARPESKATLIWEPSFASVAAAGDLGYTTGPWEFRPPADSTGASPPPDQIAYGHFISVWRKQPDGVWKVAVDIGVSHDKPALGLGKEQYVAGPTGTKNELGAAPDVAALERKLSDIATKSGWAKALESVASDDLRLNREGSEPLQGRDAARKALSKDKLAVTWRPEGTGYASSRDLAYAYGVAAVRPQKSKSGTPDSSVYLHVWRLEAKNAWKLCMAVENPLPKAK
jgi:ketosteroid isomerase-like protein